MLISLAAANVAVADLASPIMEIQLYGSFPGYGNGSMFFHTYDSESNTETSVKDYLPNNLFQGAQDTGFINSGKTLKLDRNPRDMS
jgi:hypothetical protein